MHDVFYILHLLGAIIILFAGIFLSIKKEISFDVSKKISVYMMSAAHTQLLTGFILFFMLLSEANHMKIGIKMLFAFVIATLATMYKKKIFSNITPHKLILPSILLSTVLIVIIAFLV